MTVSVVIPTYNRAHVLKDAIDSVAGQTCPPFELIVVDDGSTDETAVVLDQLASQDWPFEFRYVQQPNAGGNVARNRGVLEARGEAVAFLDSDDLWWPDKLERQVGLLAQSEKTVAVYCGLREVDLETGAVLRTPSRAYPSGDLSTALLISDVTSPTSTYLVRRAALIEAGLFDETLAARQDWDMWIRVAQCGWIEAVPAPLVDLRHHSGPRTVSDPDRELRAYARILDKYAPLRAAAGGSVRRRALAAYHRRSGRVALRYKGMRGSALTHYFKAIGLEPACADGYAALLGAFLPANARQAIRPAWNAVFGRTPLAIRSH